MPSQVLRTRYNLLIYAIVVPAIVVALVGLGVGVFHIDWPWVAGAIAFSIVTALFTLSRGWFTSVELDDGGVRLYAPLHRVTIRRSEVVSLNLRTGSPWEDSKPLWSQVALLEVFLKGGRRIDVGTLDVSTLRAIASHLQGEGARSG